MTRTPEPAGSAFSQDAIILALLTGLSVFAITDFFSAALVLAVLPFGWAYVAYLKWAAVDDWLFRREPAGRVGVIMVAMAALVFWGFAVHTRLPRDPIARRMARVIGLPVDSVTPPTTTDGVGAIPEPLDRLPIIVEAEPTPDAEPDATDEAAGGAEIALPEPPPEPDEPDPPPPPAPPPPTVVEIIPTPEPDDPPIPAPITGEMTIIPTPDSEAPLPLDEPAASEVDDGQPLAVQIAGLTDFLVRGQQVAIRFCGATRSDRA